MKKSTGFLLMAVMASWGLAAQQDEFFEGLGSHHRKVTTNSPTAQRYFDQGLAFLFAFNHDEAIRSFTKAAEQDPECAMAWWGIAIANGPHINNPAVEPDKAKAAWDAANRARKASAGGTATEKALIRAALTRYSSNPNADRGPLDRAYAAAMRRVWKTNSRDADVGALFAEAMMDLRPWDLWKANGQPQPGTREIVATLERVLEIDRCHPLGLHLYIHSVEASPNPHRAIAAADRLRDLQPALGHMVHMPSHIDVRTGDWRKAIIANEKAIVADQRYRERNADQGFYRVYMAHNHHMLALAAMMKGERAKALEAIDGMLSVFPPEFLEAVAPLVDGYTAMPIEVRVRFGMWHEVLEMPDLPDHFPLGRSLRFAARAVAYAASGEPDKARAEQSFFYNMKKSVAKEATFGNNRAADILLVATHLMNGEILLAEGKIDKALATLREAVRAEDQLRYDEPPDWIQPTRHTLGAALLTAGKPAEAARVYRADLVKHPNNGWALYGLATALEKMGKTAEARRYREKFQVAWQGADVSITSSCLCLPDAGKH
jgi:tetratricopeptide (TPR) repeat protein